MVEQLFLYNFNPSFMYSENPFNRPNPFKGLHSCKLDPHLTHHNHINIYTLPSFTKTPSDDRIEALLKINPFAPPYTISPITNNGIEDYTANIDAHISSKRPTPMDMPCLTFNYSTKLGERLSNSYLKQKQLQNHEELLNQKQKMQVRFQEKQVLYGRQEVGEKEKQSELQNDKQLTENQELNKSNNISRILMKQENKSESSLKNDQVFKNQNVVKSRQFQSDNQNQNPDYKNRLFHKEQQTLKIKNPHAFAVNSKELSLNDFPSAIQKTNKQIISNPNDNIVDHNQILDYNTKISNHSAPIPSKSAQQFEQEQEIKYKIPSNSKQAAEVRNEMLYNSELLGVPHQIFVDGQKYYRLQMKRIGDQ